MRKKQLLDFKQQRNEIIIQFVGRKQNKIKQINISNWAVNQAVALKTINIRKSGKIF